MAMALEQTHGNGGDGAAGLAVKAPSGDEAAPPAGTATSDVSDVAHSQNATSDVSDAAHSQNATSDVSGAAQLEPAAPASAPKPRRPVPAHRITRIIAASPWYETGLGELARSWELLLVFTWRQIGVQYKQAVLGIGWAVLAPLLSTLVYSFVFGKLVSVPSEGLPYPVFVLSGLITWQFFVRALSAGSTSILGNSAIITKVYFPRMILPLSAVLAGFVDYAVNLAVMVALMLFYGFAPGPEMAALPVFMLLAAMIGFAFSLWLSALNALYRDIGFMIPIALQAWMFMTPVIYPASLVPTDWIWIMQINPMTVVVEGARWAMLPSTTPPDLASVAVLAGEIAVLFLGGVVTFNKIDAVLADRI
jgi:lipopolysaccharide transport system permease protein